LYYYLFFLIFEDAVTKKSRRFVLSSRLFGAAIFWRIINTARAGEQYRDWMDLSVPLLLVLASSTHTIPEAPSAISEATRTAGLAFVCAAGRREQ